MEHQSFLTEPEAVDLAQNEKAPAVRKAPRFPLSKKALLAVASVLLICGSAAIISMTKRGERTVSATLHSVEQKQEMIVAQRPRGQCASWKENCYNAGCCNVAGLNCFLTKPGKDRYGTPFAKCKKSCTPSPTNLCTQPPEVMQPNLHKAVTQPGSSLYCFSVVTNDTGSTKPNYELQLVTGQYQKDIGIFACDQTGVFSDAPQYLAPGVPVTQVFDVEGDWHFAKRKTTGSWINTGLFSQVWKAIAAEGHWMSADWVVKVDPDAVFVPSRLVKKLQGQKVSANGVYLENCKYVDYGYFGNLEVYSHQAFATLLPNIDACKKEIKWKVGIKNGKYGPMGEDLFAQICMDKHGVQRLAAFHITTDGACPADRSPGSKKNKKWQPDCAQTSTPAMHPFKTPDQFFKCYDLTVASFGY
jgi:hypothetical protein